MAKRMIHMPADTDLHHLFVVHVNAEKLLCEHGLSDWSIVFENTKRRGGICRKSSKTIGVSAHLFAIWTYEQCINVVLHEIAHALVPPVKRGKRWDMHGKAWQAKAIEIGCSGTRCWGSNGEAKLERSPAKWVGECPNGHQVFRRRWTKKTMERRHSCYKCSGTVFDPATLIVWRENT